LKERKKGKVVVIVVIVEVDEERGQGRRGARGGRVDGYSYNVPDSVGEVAAVDGEDGLVEQGDDEEGVVVRRFANWP
jgi:hypothetical protein